MAYSKQPYISAGIRSVRLLSEKAEVNTAIVGENIQLDATDRTEIEARWEVTPKGESVLTISPTLDTEFKSQETDAVVFIYKSKHDVHFLVSSYIGFDPLKDLPEDAFKPYMEMALWIVKGRAQGSIRNMGLTQFTWPTAKSDNDEEEPSLLDKKTNKSRPKTKTTRQKTSLT